MINPQVLILQYQNAINKIYGINLRLDLNIRFEY